MSAEKRLLKAPELAEYIGTTLLNVYQMVSKKQIPYVKIGRSVRFDMARKIILDILSGISNISP